MKTYDSNPNYVLVNSQELESWVAHPQSIPQPVPPKRVPRLNLDRLWNFLLDSFSKTPEPSIRRKCDRHGNLYFQVYDPDTHMTTTFASEQEVRIWIEQRYYR
jgi:hypothetical protein